MRETLADNSSPPSATGVCFRARIQSFQSFAAPFVRCRKLPGRLPRPVQSRSPSPASSPTTPCSGLHARTSIPTSACALRRWAPACEGMTRSAAAGFEWPRGGENARGPTAGREDVRPSSQTRRLRRQSPPEAFRPLAGIAQAGHASDRTRSSALFDCPAALDKYRTTALRWQEVCCRRCPTGGKSRFQTRR